MSVCLSVCCYVLSRARILVESNYCVVAKLIQLNIYDINLVL